MALSVFSSRSAEVLVLLNEFVEHVCDKLLDPEYGDVIKLGATE